MGELGELRNKVDRAVNRLSEAHESRRHQSQGLMTLLTDLETKFEARNEEVLHCKQRIEALTRENTDLSGLVEQLVKIVDNTVRSDDEDALFRASATAAELVADWSGPRDQPETAENKFSNDEVVSSTGLDRNLEDLIAAKLGYDPAAGAFAGLDPDQGFQDVGEEELATEELRGIPEELSALVEEVSSFDIDDDVSVEDINEPFEVIELEDQEMAAELSAAELDVDGIDMPEINITQIDMADTDVVDLETTELDIADTFDPVQERLAADLDIPKITLDDEEPISHLDAGEDTESSIRAMMARLEQAAARAKAHSEETETEVELEEAPAIAVGGSS